MLSTRCCAMAGVVALSYLASIPPHGDEKRGLTAAESEAAALVRQALDNELAGDGAARERLLREATVVAPDYAPARWHLGAVRVGKEWRPIAAALARHVENELDVQYAARRSDAAGSAAEELNLAQWCLKQDMPDRARLHFWQVIHNPKATTDQVKSAAGRLDLVTVGGLVLTRAELKVEQERERQIDEAITRHRPILAALQQAIDGEFGKKRDTAVAKLRGIDDPDVIAAAETFLKVHHVSFGEELVGLLSQFPQYEATQSLVRFGVLSPFSSVRERAIGALESRPLLAGLIAPIQSQFRAEVDRRGVIRYQHAFAQDAAAATFVFDQRLALNPAVHRSYRGESGEGNQRKWGTWSSSNGVGPDLALLEVSLLASAQELAVSAANRAANQNNDPVFDALERTTGQQIPRQVDPWVKWWQGYNQVTYRKPTYYRYQQSQRYYARAYQATFRTSSCFLAGTPVWTESGLRPIESIQPGDRVLSQDPDSGELVFKVVTGKTVCPPAEASTLNILGESITTTLGHPLWVTGQGWEMAKHVKPGDQLHGVHGILVVSTIDPLPNKIEAHNLVVDEFGTYFVGNCGLLVHDNTYRQPTRAVVPGLVP
jgi:pretoxin HINT domain-containing protein